MKTYCGAAKTVPRGKLIAMKVCIRKGERNPVVESDDKKFKARHFREEDGEGAENGKEMQEILME